MRLAKTLMGLLSLTLLTSCASYMIRKECEKTNWFEHGRKIALSGRRATGDEHVVKCTKAEADIDSVALDRGFKSGMETYCQPETIFQVGKRGEFFNAEMCDGEQPRLLKKKHEEGVLEYCQRSNGYTAGAKGQPYNGICPKNLESAFMPEFNRGRKAYLTTQITNAEEEIQTLDRETKDLQMQQTMAQAELMTVRARAPIEAAYSTDPASQAALFQHRENHRIQVQDTQMRLDNVSMQLMQKKNQRSALQQKIRDLRTEITALGE